MTGKKYSLKKVSDGFIRAEFLRDFPKQLRNIALEAVKIAKENGAVVSYDLNYRGSLWKDRGGKDAANELNREFLPFADVVYGVISDDFKPSVAEFDAQKFQKAAEKMRGRFSESANDRFNLARYT